MSSALMPELRLLCGRATNIIQVGAIDETVPQKTSIWPAPFPLEEAGEVDLMAQTVSTADCPAWHWEQSHGLGPSHCHSKV